MVMQHFPRQKCYISTKSAAQLRLHLLVLFHLQLQPPRWSGILLRAGRQTPTPWPSLRIIYSPGNKCSCNVSVSWENERRRRSSQKHNPMEIRRESPVESNSHRFFYPPTRGRKPYKKLYMQDFFFNILLYEKKKELKRSKRLRQTYQLVSASWMTMIKQEMQAKSDLRNNSWTQGKEREATTAPPLSYLVPPTDVR